MFPFFKTSGKIKIMRIFIGKNMNQQRIERNLQK